MAEKYLNQVFLKEFIEVYRSFPCLWKVKSTEYANRAKRQHAYEHLINLCKRVYPQANLEFVKNKIQNIRTVFKKELNKVNASQKSGSSADDVYVPRLWYFDLLLFTVDQEVPREPLSIFHTCMTENSTQEDLLCPADDYSFSEASTSSQVDEEQPRQSQPLLQPPRLDRIRKRKGSEEPRILTENGRLRRDRDEFDAFAINVAAKMRRMDEEQRLFAELMITNTLIRGLQNRLTDPKLHCRSNQPSASTYHPLPYTSTPVPDNRFNSPPSSNPYQHPQHSQNNSHTNMYV
ncbi:hypothetical protein GDO86_018089 [Hymenochirus boettgeri]|uniref:MADF domain-containing protein n=1 Tax=Hymenochirus boettgeri TaxID=247094 RepID=A0A8T2IF42_9PIPI|nr:hypothetical protein GDO86_018089 [Hymenochirus boettgeri]